MDLKLVFMCVIFNFFVNNGNAKLMEFYRWKQIAYADLPNNVAPDFLFPDQMHRMIPTNNETFVPYNNIPMGAFQYKGRMFVTVPRRRPGVPATLNYFNINEEKTNRSPRFRGYPNYETNTLHPTLQPDSNRIISVYRTRVDVCNRLWFIDTGLLEYPNNRQQVQRPSIWIIDLNTDRRLRRFEIPASVVEFGNGLASLTIDVDRNNCGDAYAYIPDLAAYSLSVYSFRQDRMWTFRHNYFHFDPMYGDLNIGGVEFQWDDGIFSVTLGRKNRDGYRTLYFHPMCSISEFSVSTRVLQSEALASRSNHQSDFKFLGTRGQHKQTAMHQFDENSGIMFYSEVGRNAIGCWNSAVPFIPANHGTVEQNNASMIYPSDLSIDATGTIWVMTNTLPTWIYSQLNVNEYNFRIWRNTVSKAIENTICTSTVNRFGDENDDDSEIVITTETINTTDVAEQDNV